MNYIRINEMDDIYSHILSIGNPVICVIREGTGGFYGKLCGKFGFICGDEQKGLMKIVNNFVAYETKAGRKPFVFLLKNAQLNQDDVDLSNDDWVVHSTDKKSLESIIKTGKLLSLIELDRQKIKYLDFGREYLNEPPDYYDLIEFGDMNYGHGSEMVVASKMQKRFVNENEEYTPGGRIYIKKETLIKHDGYIDFFDHCAIKGTLNLSDVEHEIISASDFEDKKWTPKKFYDEANKLFNERIKKDSSNFA
jgi:hypothetical protein